MQINTDGHMVTRLGTLLFQLTQANAVIEALQKENAELKAQLPKDTDSKPEPAINS